MSPLPCSHKRRAHPNVDAFLIGAERVRIFVRRVMGGIGPAGLDPAPSPLTCAMAPTLQHAVFLGGEDEFQVHWPSWSRSGPFLRTHTKPAPNKKRAGPSLRLGLAPLIFLRPLSADQSETLRQAQRRASGQPGSRENRRFALGAASKRRLGVWAGQRRSARSLGFEKGCPLYSLSKRDRGFGIDQASMFGRTRVSMLANLLSFPTSLSQPLARPRERQSAQFSPHPLRRWVADTFGAHKKAAT